MGPLTWADGGLATTLQDHGLAAFTPVDGWLLAHPDRIRAAHRAFVDAGAELILAGTFRAYLDPALAGVAIALARDAGAPLVYASVGPGPADAITAFARDGGPRVDGIVLETFVDPDELLTAVRAVRAVYAGPLIASRVPRPNADLRPLVDAGADGVGFNCGVGPEQVLDAIRATPDPGAPLWAKPAGGPGDVEALIELTERCRWVGGCCGVGPDRLRAARSAVEASGGR